jgi:hypothetical protein
MIAVFEIQCNGFWLILAGFQADAGIAFFSGPCLQHLQYLFADSPAPVSGLHKHAFQFNCMFFLHRANGATGYRFITIIC